MYTYNLLILIKLNFKYIIKFQCILKMSISLFICKQMLQKCQDFDVAKKDAK